jgi:hypothetical protein
MKCQQLTADPGRKKKRESQETFVRGRTACVVEMGMWMDLMALQSFS